jgi:hypothetical protein
MDRYYRTAASVHRTICAPGLGFGAADFQRLAKPFIYRWRESIAIALSRMKDKSLHGYLAYRSIQSYLAQHGLGLISGEADPLPTGTQLRELIYDPARLEKLFQDAAKTPIEERPR